MKIVTNRASLLDAAQWVGRAIGKFVPIVSALRLEVNDTGALLQAFDYDLSLTASVSGEVGETGTALLPAHAFTQYLASQKSELVTIQSDGGKIIVEAGRSRSEFPTVGDVQDYPRLPEVKGKPLGMVRSEVLEDAITKLLPVAGKRDDAATPWRDALFITADQGEIEFVAAIRFRMGKLRYKAHVDGLDIMVSASALANASKGLKGEVDVYVNGGIVRLSTEDRTATVRLADKANKPNVAAIFDLPTPDLFTVDRDEMLGALKSVGMSSDQVGMRIGAGEIEVHTHKPTKGERLADVTEVVSCDTDVRGQALASLEHFTACLRGLEDGPVEISTNLANYKPIHLKAGRGHFLFMPLKRSTR